MKPSLIGLISNFFAQNPNIMSLIKGIIYPEKSVDAKTNTVKKCIHSLSMDEKVAFFLKSKDFQSYCNRKKNNVKENSILWIVGSGEYYQPTIGIGGHEIELDFYLVPSNEKFFLYKAPSFVNKPSCKDREINFSQSYIIRKDSNGKWMAEVLLPKEGLLKPNLVKAAFEKISFNLTSSVAIHKIEHKGKELFAWAATAQTPKGRNRILVCLLDNGQILDLPAKYLKEKISPHSIIRTYFNWFRYHYYGELERK